MAFNNLNELFCLVNFNTTQKIKTRKVNYCETVFTSTFNLEKEVVWPGDWVCFSSRPKLEAVHLK